MYPRAADSLYNNWAKSLWSSTETSTVWRTRVSDSFFCHFSVRKSAAARTMVANGSEMTMKLFSRRGRLVHSFEPRRRRETNRDVANDDMWNSRRSDP